MKFVILLGMGLGMIPASAHRLDEYLQATRLSVGIENVAVEIDLTPGAAVASQVFGWIDTDRDGEISSAEGDAYAREMLRSVVLKVDGLAAPMELTGVSFPQFDEMSAGFGIIHLRANAKIPAAGAGRHRVSFLNTHRPEGSVYLVNALVPENPRIQLGAPQRDIAQHGLTLDYVVMPETPAPANRTLVVLAGLGMVGCLFLRHGRALLNWV